MKLKFLISLVILSLFIIQAFSIGFVRNNAKLQKRKERISKTGEGEDDATTTTPVVETPKETTETTPTETPKTTPTTPTETPKTTPTTPETDATATEKTPTETPKTTPTTPETDATADTTDPKATDDATGTDATKTGTDAAAKAEPTGKWTEFMKEGFKNTCDNKKTKSKAIKKQVYALDAKGDDVYFTKGPSKNVIKLIETFLGSSFQEEAFGAYNEFLTYKSSKPEKKVDAERLGSGAQQNTWKMEESIPTDEGKRLLGSYDQNEDGYLDKKEFVYMLVRETYKFPIAMECKNCLLKTRKLLSNFFDYVDCNEDLKISSEDFFKILDNMEGSTISSVDTNDFILKCFRVAFLTKSDFMNGALRGLYELKVMVAQPPKAAATTTTTKKRRREKKQQ